jgi:hypothetical protein
MNKSFFICASAFIFTIFIITNNVYSQDGPVFRVVNTAVPFLTISPEARGGGMGDIGVATSPDATSLFWNPAKYAFLDHKMSFQASYVPWLQALVDDIGLMSIYGVYKINDKSAVAASLRYFSLGEIQFVDEFGINKDKFEPNEFVIDATYSRKFSEKISGAVAGKFIYSNLTQGQSSSNTEDVKAGVSVAADVAFYYQQPFDNVATGSTLSVGVNIANIGTKISYTDTNLDNYFIPTILRFGPTYEINIDRYNSIAIGLDISKLLVPTPPEYKKDSSGALIKNTDGTYAIAKGYNPNVSVFKGMLQSFYDAPGGFSEEMKELMWSFGAEYWYNKMFGVRAGYFFENKDKGNRQWLGIGASIAYNIVNLTFSYVVPTNGRNNPQDNTLRFTLTFNIN